jgi:hypothetical protein
LELYLQYRIYEYVIQIILLQHSWLKINQYRFQFLKDKAWSFPTQHTNLDSCCPKKMNLVSKIDEPFCPRARQMQNTFFQKESMFCTKKSVHLAFVQFLGSKQRVLYYDVWQGQTYHPKRTSTGWTIICTVLALISTYLWQ